MHRSRERRGASGRCGGGPSRCATTHISDVQPGHATGRHYIRIMSIQSAPGCDYWRQLDLAAPREWHSHAPSRWPDAGQPPSTSNSTSRRSIIMRSVAKLLQSASASILSVEPLPDIVDRVLIEAHIQATRDVADMWCRQQVRLAAKRMIGWQRLLVEDVDPGAGDFAASRRRPARSLSSARTTANEPPRRGSVRCSLMCGRITSACSFITCILTWPDMPICSSALWFPISPSDLPS
jgi:hypothetical protein